MHEMSIAQALIEQVIDNASHHGITKVTHIDVDLGVQRLVEPEAMQEAFRALAENTLAQHANLNLNEVPLRAQCLTCDLHFQPSLDDYLCPHCQLASVRIIEGNDIILRAISGETTTR